MLLGAAAASVAPMVVMVVVVVMVVMMMVVVMVVVAVAVAVALCAAMAGWRRAGSSRLRPRTQDEQGAKYPHSNAAPKRTRSN